MTALSVLKDFTLYLIYICNIHIHICHITYIHVCIYSKINFGQIEVLTLKHKLLKFEERTLKDQSAMKNAENIFKTF